VAIELLSGHRHVIGRARCKIGPKASLLSVPLDASYSEDDAFVEGVRVRAGDFSRTHFDLDVHEGLVTRGAKPFESEELERLME
jgi:hypothetical protein